MVVISKVYFEVMKIETQYVLKTEHTKKRIKWSKFLNF